MAFLNVKPPAAPPLMSFIRLSFAFLSLVAAAAVFTIAFGNEQAAKSDMQLFIRCALHIRFVHTATG